MSELEFEQRIELSNQQVYQLLQEAFTLKLRRMNTQNSQMDMRLLREICKIQVVFHSGMEQSEDIDDIYLSMLEHWNESDERREELVIEAAQALIQLRK